jgi:hypothetical protein
VFAPAGNPQAIEGAGSMKRKTAHLALALSMLFVFACEYIVLPDEDETGSVYGANLGWDAMVTGVGATAAGDLKIDLTIRNDTADWSAMRAEEKPAVLTASDGRKTNCASVFVGTGGHRLAPGFQMRGYIAGKKSDPVVQMISVECKGAAAGAGSVLTIEYSYVTGPYNYYEQDKTKAFSKLEIALDEVATDLQYPVAQSLDDLIKPSDTAIQALNDVVFTLQGISRTDTGLRFQWQTDNPGEYPTYVHIGNPPVIGDDGILYGFYETPDIVSAPITPSGGTAAWTTEVAVPDGIGGLYLLLSVETGKARLFANYAIEIPAQ